MKLDLVKLRPEPLTADDLKQGPRLGEPHCDPTSPAPVAPVTAMSGGSEMAQPEEPSPPASVSNGCGDSG